MFTIQSRTWPTRNHFELKQVEPNANKNSGFFFILRREEIVWQHIAKGQGWCYENVGDTLQTQIFNGFKTMNSLRLVKASWNFKNEIANNFTHTIPNKIIFFIFVKYNASKKLETSQYWRYMSGRRQHEW